MKIEQAAPTEKNTGAPPMELPVRDVASSESEDIIKRMGLESAYNGGTNRGDEALGRIVGRAKDSAVASRQENPEDVISRMGLDDAYNDPGFDTGGFVKETVKGVGRVTVGAAVDAVEGLKSLVHDTAAGAASLFKKTGLTEEQLIPDREKGTSWSDQLFGPPQSTSETFVKGILSYAVPYMGVAKGFKNMGMVGRIGTSVGIQTAITDPDNERLSNIIHDYNIPIVSPVAEYLAYKEDDSRLVSRFKTAVEAALFDIPMEGALVLVNSIRASKQAKNLAKQLAKAESGEGQALAKAGTPEGGPIVGEQPALPEGAAPVAKAPEGAVPPEAAVPPAEKPAPGTLSRTKDGKPVLRVLKDVDGDQLIKDIDETFGTGNMGDRAKVADAVKSGKPDAVAKAIDMEKEINDLILQRKRGVMTDEELLEKAAAILKDDDKFTSVIDRLKNEGVTLNAEEITSLRMALNKADAELLSLDAAIKDLDAATPAELAAFDEKLKEYLSHHMRIRVAAGEQGRAQRSLQVALKDAPDNQTKADILENFIELSGGVEGMRDRLKSFRALKSINERISVQKTVAETGVAMSKGMQIGEAMNAVAMENLLAGMDTVVANVAGGFFVNVEHVANTIVARGIRIAKSPFSDSPNGVREGEIANTLSGFAEGLLDGLTAVKQFVTKGETIAGTIKYEARSNAGQMIGDVLGIDRDGGVGTALKYLGEVHALGARGTQIGDVFNANVAARTRLRTLAHREGLAHGAQGSEAYKKAHARVMADRKYDFYADAVRRGRETSFSLDLNEEMFLGKMGSSVDEVLKNYPVLKPASFFLRFGLNLANYGIERSPVFMLSPRMRSALKAGGAVQDEALARIAIGNTFLLGASYWASTGSLTGGGPKNYDVSRMQEQMGRPTDSIKIGDNWYKYTRLGPMGVPLKMAGDISELLSHYDEGDNPSAWQDLIFGAAAVISDNFLPQSLVDLSDTMGQLHKIMNGQVTEGTNQIISKLMMTYTPFSGVATKIAGKIGQQIEGPENVTKKDIRPEDSDANRLMQIWEMYKNDWLSKNPIAGFGESKLPPIRNRITGEPLSVPTGLGIHSLSPIATMQDTSDDIVFNEILSLQMAGPFFKKGLPDGDEYLEISRLPRTIQKGGVPVRLSPEQYDRFQELASGVGLDPDYVQDLLPDDADMRGAFLGKGLYDMIRYQIENDYPLIEQMTGATKNTDTAKVAVIKKIMTVLEGAARNQLLAEYPELMQEIGAGVANRLEALGFPEDTVMEAEEDTQRAVELLENSPDLFERRQ